MTDTFAYLSVLLSIVLGLAIAEILQGYGALLRSRTKVRLYAPPLIWSVMMLMMATQFWWVSFGLAKREHWSFAAFCAVLLQTVMMYMGSSLILPKAQPDQEIDLRTHYYREARPFFTFGLLPGFRSPSRPAARTAASARKHGLHGLLRSHDGGRAGRQECSRARSHRASDGSGDHHVLCDPVLADLKRLSTPAPPRTRPLRSVRPWPCSPGTEPAHRSPGGRSGAPARLFPPGRRSIAAIGQRGQGRHR